MCKHEDSSFGFAMGILGGVVAGIVAGVLLAPKPGEETRKELKVKLDELLAKAKEIDTDEVKENIELKVKQLHKPYVRLRAEEILLALSIQALTNPLADLAMKQLPKLRGSELHSSTILSEVDRNTFKALGIHVTEEPSNYQKKLYYKG